MRIQHARVRLAISTDINLVGENRGEMGRSLVTTDKMATLQLVGLVI